MSFSAPAPLLAGAESERGPRRYGMGLQPSTLRTGKPLVSPGPSRSTFAENGTTVEKDSIGVVGLAATKDARSVKGVNER
jgi:hypothetical protein